MDELFLRIRKEQDAELQQSALRDAVEQRLARRTPMPDTPQAATRRGLLARVVPVSAAALALLGVGLGGALLWPRRAPSTTHAAPLAFARTGDGVDAHGFVLGGTHTQLTFTDGSELSLAQGALARVVALHENGAEVALERGQLDVHVVHAEDTRWQLLAGPFVVHVTGTRFGLAWEAASARLHVTLREGSVRIEGPCLQAPHELAGEGEFEVTCAGWAAVSASLHDAPENASLTVAADVPAHATPLPASPSTAPTLTPPPDVRAQHATAELDTTQQAVPQVDPIDEARRALLAGESSHAETLLRSVRASNPGSERAALAAFLLGRLCFDVQHDDLSASRWFETYVRERPHGSLVREALGRRLEAEERLGHVDEARALAAQYLEAFPSGPHAARAQRLIE